MQGRLLVCTTADGGQLHLSGVAATQEEALKSYHHVEEVEDPAYLRLFLRPGDDQPVAFFLPIGTDAHKVYCREAPAWYQHHK